MLFRLFSTTLLYLIFRVINIFLLEPLFAWNFWVSFGIMIFILLILVLGLYFPTTALLGGWDDNSLNDLRKAVKMAGLSKMIVVPMTKLVFFFAPKSKLHNKFKIDETQAMKEIAELMEIRFQNRQT